MATYAQYFRDFLAYIGGASAAANSPGSAGGGLTPPANGSWSQAAWFVSPATGVDTNPGTLGAPVKDFAEIVRRWGTTSPVLRQNTRVVWLDSQLDNSDPIDWAPIMMAGAIPSIEGNAPVIVTTGVVLAGTVAKSTAAGANSLLQENLGATGAAQQFVINTTVGKSSRALAYKSLGANAFSMGQPLVPLAVGASPFVSVTEVNTWADGDTVNLATLIFVDVVRFAPTNGEFDAGFNSTGYLYQLRVPKYAGLPGYCLVGSNVRAYECIFDKILTNGQNGIGSFISFWPTLANVGLTSGIGGVVGWSYHAVIMYPGMTAPVVVAIVLDHDTILGSQLTVQGTMASAINGNVFLDNNLVLSQGSMSMNNAARLYGSGGGFNLALRGQSRFNLTGGGFVAALTGPTFIASGVSMNGALVANSVVVGTPDVLNGNIATTPANLDAAAGVAGFGGLAFNLGGASIATTV